MQPPSFKKLNMDDYPGAPQWLFQLFQQLNPALAGLVNVISKRVTRGDNLQGSDQRDIAFTTKATAADTFPLSVKWNTPQAPVHVVCTKLQRADNKPLTAAFSMTWGLTQAGQLQLWFQGLDASVQYVANIAYE